jgi:hypothetical protein
MQWVGQLPKAIPKATEETITEFIYVEIHAHYGAPLEIFMEYRK